MNIEVTRVVNRNSRTNCSTIDLTIDGINYRLLKPIYRNAIQAAQGSAFSLWKEMSKKGMYYPMETSKELQEASINAINVHLSNS